MSLCLLMLVGFPSIDVCMGEKPTQHEKLMILFKLNEVRQGLYLIGKAMYKLPGIELILGGGWG